MRIVSISLHPAIELNTIATTIEIQNLIGLSLQVLIVPFILISPLVTALNSSFIQIEMTRSVNAMFKDGNM